MLGCQTGKFDGGAARRGTVPVRTILWYLKTVSGLKLSTGRIVGAIHRVARRAQPPVVEVLDRPGVSRVVHADETGWRQDGKNGYVWTYSTTTERYFLSRGRNKEVVDEALVWSFCGVSVRDFYDAYNHYPGLNQGCWAHLLRDIHELEALYPKDPRLRKRAKAVRKVYFKVTAFSRPADRQHRRAQGELERRLRANCRPFLEEASAVQSKLCRRIDGFIKELFVFLAYPETPPDNNVADRSLRPLVTSRKISGGMLSEQGTTTKVTLTSLFGTWRDRQLNQLVACRRLLVYPQL